MSLQRVGNHRLAVNFKPSILGTIVNFFKQKHGSPADRAANYGSQNSRPSRCHLRRRFRNKIPNAIVFPPAAKNAWSSIIPILTALCYSWGDFLPLSTRRVLRIKQEMTAVQTPKDNRKQWENHFHSEWEQRDNLYLSTFYGGPEAHYPVGKYNASITSTSPCLLLRIHSSPKITHYVLSTIQYIISFFVTTNLLSSKLWLKRRYTLQSPQQTPN